MAVSAYDSKFSYKQDKIERLGEQAKFTGTMSGAKFANMQARMQRLEENALNRLSQRDARRAQTDPTFVPRDDDFNAPKAHSYDKAINYYEVLGLDEFAPQGEIKRVYKKLSLVYHPDKTSSMSQEEKDEYAAVFIELKNAYKTLSDNPTRRQYDHDRDRDKATADVYGGKIKVKPNFDGFAALQKLVEKKGPSEVVEVHVPCKLEKFVHGGHKLVRRRRMRMTELGTKSEVRLFHIDVPAGASEPRSSLFRRQGDQHLDREPDSLKFAVSAKSHALMERRGQDLCLKEPLDCGHGWRSRPYLAVQVPCVQGRRLLLWGRNPFRHCGAAAGDGQLRVVTRGFGLPPEGALRCQLRLGLEEEGGSPPPTWRWEAQCEAKRFLRRYGLEPPEGFATRRCLARSSAQRLPEHDVELRQVCAPVVLHTRPSCSITFYSNFGQSAQGQPSCPMLAIGISSVACAGKKAARDWQDLCARLIPLLEATGFLLLRLGRGLLPRPLAGAASAPAAGGPAAAGAGPAELWGRLGREAFSQGDVWQALAFFSRCLETAPAASFAAARALANRAACLAKVGEHAAALADARRAAELAPEWPKAWLRLGTIAEAVGGAEEEALAALARAAELAPGAGACGALRAAAGRLRPPGAEAAHAAKESGNAALQACKFGVAVAQYTLGLAYLPLPADSAEPPSGQNAEAQTVLRAILFTNRSAAFSRLGSWDNAVADAREAVALQPRFAKAQRQLGVALLAARLPEEAYEALARAADLERGEQPQRARRCLAACLTELQRWRSLPARRRREARFGLDFRRPRGSTRIFATSDVHFDHGYNDDWAYNIDPRAFQDDVLIVAGNLAETKVAVLRALSILKSKFRRVFYTVGNHELRIGHSEASRQPDSLAKLLALLAACDEAGVDVAPAPVCEGAFVVPLFAWYTAEFHEEEPWPDSSEQPDARCKWPMDADMQVWKYMLKLNEEHLKLPYHGTVVTFSHFLPRRSLPFNPASAKTMGCEMLDEQVRAAGSLLHVHGHSHCPSSEVQEGVRYVHAPAANSEREVHADAPLVLIFDGGAVCAQAWGTDGRRR